MRAIKNPIVIIKINFQFQENIKNPKGLVKFYKIYPFQPIKMSLETMHGLIKKLNELKK